MLQQDLPEDFVIATGEPHAVRELLEVAAREVGIAVRWEQTLTQKERPGP